MEEQQCIKFILTRAIHEYNKVYIKFNRFNHEDEILFNNNKIGSIKLGTNPIYNKFTRYSEINYYLLVCFAGLKSYNSIIDNLSYNCLLTTYGTLNTFNFDYRFTELDICLDMNTKIQNILAICTTKLPRTEYHLANHSFYNGDTIYIEKITKGRLNYYSQRAYVYNKAKKEKLFYPLTRFELKLQKSFFLNNELDSRIIVKALNRYLVMYFKNIEEKEKVINKYNSYNRVSKRDIDRMNLDRYRVNLDVKKISNFLDRLKSYRLC
jgi:hypothetical protein